MFLIHIIKPKVEKKLKHLFYLMCSCLEDAGELEAHKIKPFLFLFALGLLATKKLYSNKRENT